MVVPPLHPQAPRRAGRPLAAVVAALLSMLTVFALTTGTTAAAAIPEERSFPGCPLLLESRSSGPCVQALQTYLNIVYGGYGLTEDGRFGAATRTAVLDFQGRNGLPADGNVGPVTADHLLARVDDVRKANTPPVVDPVPPRDPGAALALGRPVMECIAERVKDKISTTFVKALLARRLSAKDLARELSRKAGVVDGAKIVWCISFEKAD